MENVNEQEEELLDNLEEFVLESMPDLKPDVKLPNTDAQWTEADLFFRAELSISEIDESSVNECVLKMTNTIYDLFANSFGTMKRSKSSDEELHNRYANYTKQELKRALKDLKRNSSEDKDHLHDSDRFKYSFMCILISLLGFIQVQRFYSITDTETRPRRLIKMHI